MACKPRGYPPKVEKALDSLSDSFESSDFLGLALACLDQAGLSVRTQMSVAKLVDSEMPLGSERS